MFEEFNIFKEFNDSTILITGGTGLIGRAVVNLLLKNTNAKIMILSLDQYELWPDEERVSQHFVDLSDFEQCLIYTNHADFVFHLAGVKGSIDMTIQKPASFFVPLLMMNTNVLEACRRNCVKKVLYTSSIGAYKSAEIFRESMGYSGEPMDFYPGWAKRMAEFQVQTYKKQYDLNNFVIVRPCNVYGPGDNFDPNNAMVIPSLIYKAINGPFPVKIWGDGSSIRDFAYSEDVAMGIIQAMHFMPNVDFINLGSGIGVSIKELVETLNEVVPFEYEWDKTKGNGFPKRILDISLAKKKIEYNPKIVLLEGLARTYNWYLRNKEEFLERKNYFKDE